MPEPAKETVIIVHGTWAAPEPGKTRWYQPVDGIPAAERFVTKLDAALQKRGSPARCWGHCIGGNPIFQWSGENSWIARTRAASALGDYVAKLRNDGWRCHIVAHSHGGNVVAEAWPQIFGAPSPNEQPGRIVTLGSPFMDTMSPLAARARQVRSHINVANWIGMAVIFILTAWLGFNAILDVFSGWVASLLIVFNVFFWLWMIWVTRPVRTEAGELHRNAQAQPLMLAIGSPVDEAWQVLHHMRTVNNPLAVRLNLFSYLFSSAQSSISQSANIARIRGAKSYRDLGTGAKFSLAFLYLYTCLVIYSVGFVLFWMPWERTTFYAIVPMIVLLIVIIAQSAYASGARGEEFLSTYLYPFRVVKGALIPFLWVVVTYAVRYFGWPVMLEMVMGLTGYGHKIPLIEQHPSYIPKQFVRYEDMPTGAAQRALDKRSAWIARHLGDVSQTFSKLAVTAADITSLLRTIEEDQTLVHAAYYTDDECIARIADWIASRE